MEEDKYTIIVDDIGCEEVLHYSNLIHAKKGDLVLLVDNTVLRDPAMLVFFERYDTKTPWQFEGVRPTFLLEPRKLDIGEGSELLVPRLITIEGVSYLKKDHQKIRYFCDYVYIGGDALTALEGEVNHMHGFGIYADMFRVFSQETSRKYG